MEELFKQAEQGDTEAQLQLGLAYYNGDGISKNYRKAYCWFQKAAEQGHAEAEFMLGEMLRSGKKIGKDLKKAFEWYTLASQQGHIPAKHCLAGMVYDGEGCKRDVKRGKELFEEAAKDGYAPSQMVLGAIYVGEGVEPWMAVKWFELAAEQDEQYVPYIANYLSGFMPETAFEWRLRAAQTGDAYSQYQVGKMYESGTGVDMDAEQARYWYGLAAEKDCIWATDALRNMDEYQKRAKDISQIIDNSQEDKLEDELMKSVPAEYNQKVKTLLDDLLSEVKKQLKECSDKRESLEVFKMQKGNRATTINLDSLYESQEVVVEADVINYILLSELTFPKESDMLTHACLNEAFRILQTWDSEELPEWVVSMYMAYYRRRGEYYQKGKEWSKAAKAYEEAMQIIADHYVNVEYDIPEDMDEDEAEELEDEIRENIADWADIYYGLEKEVLHCLLNGENFELLNRYFEKIGEDVIEGFSEEGDYNFYPYWTSGQYILVEEAYKMILPVLDKANQSQPWMHQHYSLYLKQTRRFVLAEKEEKRASL